MKHMKFKSLEFNLELPFFKIGDGKKILFIIDEPFEQDIIHNRLLSGDYGVIFENILAFACKDCKETRMGEYYAINFIDQKIERSLKTKDIEAFKHRVNSFINKINPNTIVLCGPVVHKQYSKNPYIVDYNRIIKIKIDNQTYSAMTSLDLNKVIKIGKEISLNSKMTSISRAGELINHFSIAINGKNRYFMPKKDFKTIEIKTIKEFDKFYNTLIKSDIVSIDTETRDLTRISNLLLTMQFTMDGINSYVIPWFHKETPWIGDDFHYIKEKLVKYFEFGVSKYHIYHNATFDIGVIYSCLGVRFYNHDIYDTGAGEFSLDENRKFLNDDGLKFKAYSLETIEYKYGLKRPTDILSKDNRKNMENQSLHDIVKYGGFDVISLYWISKFQIKEASRRGKLYDNFLNTVTRIISDMIHCFAVMQKNGLLIDRRYLMELMNKERSMFLKTMRSIADEFKSFESVQALNKNLCEKAGIPTKSLFKSHNQPTWVFSIDSSEHQKNLFFDILRLDSVALTKKGDKSTSKKFKAFYQKIPEVAKFEKYTKAKTLYSMFVKAIWRRVLKDKDVRKDGRLRCSYKYLQVVTGRAAATDPNYQALPSRGAAAKDIKREFVTDPGILFIKVDYSAHEVVCWCNLSRDPVMRKTFVTVRKTVKQYRIATKENLEKFKARLKRWGDMHIINVKNFFGEWVDKEHHLRYAIKAVVFGVMYGKGAKSLGQDLKKDEGYAIDLIDKLFSNWKKGKEFMDKTIEQGKKYLRIISGLGRVRHLWNYLHTEYAVISAADRRGPNSSIQGAGSDIGFRAGRNVQKKIWHWWKKHDIDFYLQQDNAVHDSGEYESGIEEIPLSLYMIEHSMTTEINRQIREDFGIKNFIDYDVEFEIGPSLGVTFKWDGRWDTLEGIISESIDWQIKELDYKIDKKKVMRAVRHNIKIVSSIRDKEIKNSIEGEYIVSEEQLITETNVRKLGLKFPGKTREP